MGERPRRLEVFGGMEDVLVISCHSNAACKLQPSEVCGNELKFQGSLAGCPADLSCLAHVSGCSLSVTEPAWPQLG